MDIQQKDGYYTWTIPCPRCGAGDGLFLDAYDLDDLEGQQVLPLSAECFECGAIVESQVPMARVTAQTKLELL